MHKYCCRVYEFHHIHGHGWIKRIGCVLQFVSWKVSVSTWGGNQNHVCSSPFSYVLFCGCVLRFIFSFCFELYVLESAGFVFSCVCVCVYGWLCVFMCCLCCVLKRHNLALFVYIYCYFLFPFGFGFVAWNLCSIFFLYFVLYVVVGARFGLARLDFFFYTYLSFR